MNILASLVLLFPIITGFFFICIFLQWQNPKLDHLLLKISLSIGIGFGITSCYYFLFLSLYGPSKIRMITIEIFLCMALFTYFSFSNKNNSHPVYPVSFECSFAHGTLQRIFSIGFFCTLFCSVCNSIIRSIILPHGGWDAWVIWNLHARFIFRGGYHWTDTFSSLLGPHHPDYPLLIPALVARCWHYSGVETQVVPVLTALLFTFSTLGLLIPSLAILRSRSQGFLAGLVLLGTTHFVIFGTSQYADIPVGFYFLATIVLYCFQERLPENYRYSLLAGIMAGFACWTKNEGLLFLVAFFIARITIILTGSEWKQSIRQTIFFTIGVIPGLITLIYFKTYFAPSNDLFAGQGIRQILDRLTDMSRYMQVLKAFLVFAFDTIPIVLLLFVYSFYVGKNTDRNDKICVITSLIILCMMVIGYYFVYIISPYNLNWHLVTSLPRLIIQLWPSVVFSYFLMVRTPEEFFNNILTRGTRQGSEP